MAVYFSFFCMSNSLHVTLASPVRLDSTLLPFSLLGSPTDTSCLDSGHSPLYYTNHSKYIFTHNRKTCREWGTLERSALNGMSSSNPCHLDSGTDMEEEMERSKELKAVNNSKEAASSRHNRTDTHRDSQRLWQHPQDLPRFKTDKIPTVKRKADRVPLLTEKLFVIGPWRKEKN